MLLFSIVNLTKCSVQGGQQGARGSGVRPYGRYGRYTGMQFTQLSNCFTKKRNISLLDWRYAYILYIS